MNAILTEHFAIENQYKTLVQLISQKSKGYKIFQR